MENKSTDEYVADLVIESIMARASLERMTEDRDRLMRLIKLFEVHYVCEFCSERAATYLDTCMNPLHALHDAVYGLGESNELG